MSIECVLDLPNIGVQYILLIRLRTQNAFSDLYVSIQHRRAEGYSLVVRRITRERPNRVSKKRKLTAKQERQRIDGLRILARIIARHYLDNPHLYDKGEVGDGSQTAPKEGAA